MTLQERHEQICAQARREFVGEVQSMIAEAPAYIEAYVDALLSRRAYRPMPGGMHGKACEFIREIVLDAELDARRAA